MNDLDERSIATMTARELKEYLFGDGHQATATERHDTTERRYIYSIKQLAAFLGVSYVTAWKMKNTTLKDAVYQQGRTILIDEERVLELMGRA